MKKNTVIISILFFLVVFSLLVFPAFADDGKLIDWSQYDLDQLLQIQAELEEEIYNRKVAFAKEYGNRIIDLGCESINLFTGKTFTPEISIERVLDEAPETTKLIWTSSDDSIARVDANGRITGVAKGTATISCFASDDEFVQASLEVNVVLPVTKLTIPGTLELQISESDKSPVTANLDCVIEPEDAFNKELEWTSDHEEIATVSPNGIVTAVGPGTAVISASSKDGYSDRPIIVKCTVTVRMLVSSIEFEDEQLTIDKNRSQTITYSVLPENASNKKVTWESSDPDIVSVNTNGQVTGRACGTATITCSAADGSGVNKSIEVTVVQKVTSIRWDNNTALTINKDESATPTVTILPDDATNKDLIWTSSDEKVLSVSDNGKITAVGGGTATITCSTADGSNLKITREIFVPSISISSTEYTVTSKNGLTIQFKYYGDTKNITWTASSTAFCDIYSSISGGKGVFSLSPKKAGTFTITINDSESTRSRTVIKVVVDHSAAYDTISYPKGDFSDILRNPTRNNGNQISIYGRVLQKQTSGGTTVLRVGTGGYGYYDYVFYITYTSKDIDVTVIEDDYITIYGKCTGTKTYTTVLGGSVTIPSMTAEKIIFGRN